jgi:hypothetical protein
VGVFSAYGLVFFIAAMIPAMIFIFLTSRRLTQIMPYSLLEILALLSLAIASFMLAISIVFTIFSTAVLILYFASIIRYGLKKSRQALSTNEPKSVKKYEFYINYNEGKNDVQKIYHSTIVSISKSFLYLTFGSISAMFVVFFDKLLFIGVAIRGSLPLESLLSTEVAGLLTNIGATINYSIPIEIIEILTPINIRSLLVLITLVCVFSIFLNIKKIGRISMLSEYWFYQHERFQFWEEVRKYPRLCTVLIYQLLYGDLRQEFEIVRGNILTAILSTVFSVSLALLYIAIIPESF